MLTCIDKDSFAIACVYAMLSLVGSRKGESPTVRAAILFTQETSGLSWQRDYAVALPYGASLTTSLSISEWWEGIGPYGITVLPTGGLFSGIRRQ